MRGNGPRRDAIDPPAPGGIADAKVSLTKSVAQLLPAASTFRDKTSCISCHHNGLPSMAAAAARRKGVAVNDELDRKNLDDQHRLLQANDGTRDVRRSGCRRRSADGRLHAARPRGRRPSARRRDGDDDALGHGAADAGRQLARQRPQSAAARIQHHQPHGDGRRRVGGVSAPGPPARHDREPEPCEAVVVVGGSEIRRGTRHAADGARLDRRTAAPHRGGDHCDSGATGSERRVVAVFPNGTRCLRDRPVVVRPARRRRAGRRSRVPQRRRVPARQPVPGRRVAREDPLVPRAGATSRAGSRSAAISGFQPPARAGRRSRSHRPFPIRRDSVTTINAEHAEHTEFLYLITRKSLRALCSGLYVVISSAGPACRTAPRQRGRSAARP